jgi:hypothetical protein
VSTALKHVTVVTVVAVAAEAVAVVVRSNGGGGGFSFEEEIAEECLQTHRLYVKFVIYNQKD